MHHVYTYVRARQNTRLTRVRMVAKLEFLPRVVDPNIESLPLVWVIGSIS